MTNLEKLQDKDTFEITLVVTSNDFGVMKAYCFSSTEQKKLGMSNTVQFTVNADFSGLKFEELVFMNGSGTIFVNAGDTVELNLYSKTSQGGFLDVSSPLHGTEWSVDLPEIAQVNNDGTVTGLNEGTAELTAKFKGMSALVIVNVGPAFESVLSEDNNPNGDNPDEYTPPDITTETLSNAITGQTYSHQLIATGVLPITWTLKSGMLPEGLTLSEAGLISGIPTKAGDYECKLIASNVAGSAELEVKIIVYSVPVLSDTMITIDIYEGEAVTARTVAATGNHLVWTTSGTLPDGLTVLSDDSGFAVNGTPSAGTAGNYMYTLTVSNTAGSAHAVITIIVTPDTARQIETVSSEISSTLAEALVSMTPQKAQEVKKLAVGINITDLSGLEILMNLEQLDLTEATSLTEVNLDGNTSVRSVDISGNGSVLRLNLSNSSIESVNAEGCESLEEVNIEGNKTIKELRVSETNISSLNAKNCENLEILECSSSKISSLNLEGCVKLRTLDFAGNAMRRFNAEGFARLETLICAGQQERVQTFGHVFNLFSFIMSAQVLEFSNSATDENKVLNVKCYDSSGREISSQYNPKTGEITFSQTPAKITYDYDTGFENILMDIAISTESETSSMSDTRSSSGGCKSSNTSTSLLMIILVYTFGFAITIEKQ